MPLQLTVSVHQMASRAKRPVHMSRSHPDRSLSLGNIIRQGGGLGSYFPRAMESSVMEDKIFPIHSHFMGARWR